jgi:hypothetical protein
MESDLVVITLPKPKEKEMYRVQNNEGKLLKIEHNYKMTFQGQPFKHLYLYSKDDYAVFIQKKRSWELLECHIRLLKGWLNHKDDKMANVHIGENKSWDG